MKYIKYIILVAVAGILIFCCYRIVFAPHSYRDVVSREIDNIQPSINTSSFESLSVQKFNDTKYYLDENNALWFKSPKEEKICVRQIAYFLVWQNRLIYTTTDNIKAIYEMPLLGDNKKAEKRVSEEAQIVFCTECDDADGFDMYLFDLKTKYIQKVPFFQKKQMSMQ